MCTPLRYIAEVDGLFLPTLGASVKQNRGELNVRWNAVALFAIKGTTLYQTLGCAIGVRAWWWDEPVSFASTRPLDAKCRIWNLLRVCRICR